MYKSLVSYILVLTCIVSIILLAVFYTSFDLSKLPNDYAIVFDAGSSGSRMYIYEWKSGFSAAKGDPLVITQILSCKPSDNGLDKIKSKEELIQKYSSCVGKAIESIPNDRKGRAYVFLAATAGMRLLEARNKTASDEIFSFVRGYFRELKFLFKNESQVRILSGKEEGTNAWISANYYENNFDTHSVFNWQQKTKGVLDLGGASTQIVFVPTNPNQNNKEYFNEIKIYGKVYKPYSYSFLCWGVNEISLLYQTYLLNKNNYSSQSLASCFPSNSTIMLNPSQVVNSPCANGLIFNNSLNFTANISRLDMDVKYTFMGESRMSECYSEINSLFPKPSCTYDNDQCSFNGIYQPPLDKSSFMGFSGLYYALSNTQNLLNQKLEFDQPGFKKATDTICSKTFDELVELNRTNNAGINEQFLKSMCFSNVYMLQLTENYGFKSFQYLKITDKVNGYSLNWALGYLINELNRDDFLPYEDPPRKLNFGLFLSFTIMFSLIGSIVLAVLLYKKLKLRVRSLAETRSLTKKNITTGDQEEL